jgi:polysaccharide pyruvyl transferase WcaK-like protein
MAKNILMLNYPTEISDNWGCKASYEGLQALVEAKYPGSKFRCHPIHFRVPDVPIPRDPAKFNDFIEYLSAIGWQEYTDFVWADVLILNGEGSLHEFADPAVNDFIYLKLLSIYAAKIKYGKKTMIVNHTLDFAGAEFKTLVRTVYPTCNYISVREPKSKKLLDSMGIEAALSADTAFIYPVNRSIQNGIQELPPIPESYYVFFIAQLIDVDPGYFVEVCKEIWHAYKLPAVFFVLSEREKRVVDCLKGSGIPYVKVDYFVEPSCIISVLEQAMFCLSGRFHAAIFSALANTPFIGFRSNTFKIAGLIELLNYPLPEMLFGTTGVDDIVSAIKVLLTNRQSIKAKLLRNVQSAQELARTTNVKVLG